MITDTKSEPIRLAICHPDRPHEALGLCRSCYEKGLRARNPEYKKAQIENNKRWVSLYPIKAKRSKTVSSRKSNRKPRVKARKREYQLLKDFGITLEQYNKILESQEGLCAICKRPPTKQSLAVDHDHKTGKIRGLLCFKCNYGLSWFSDNPEKFRRAASYLEKGGCCALY